MQLRGLKRLKGKLPLVGIEERDPLLNPEPLPRGRIPGIRSAKENLAGIRTRLGLAPWPMLQRVEVFQMSGNPCFNSKPWNFFGAGILVCLAQRTIRSKPSPMGIFGFAPSSFSASR